MKMILSPSRPARPARQGSAVIVVLALLAVMVLLVAANTQTVRWTRQEIKLVDERETARLAAGGAPPAAGIFSTNPPAAQP